MIRQWCVEDGMEVGEPMKAGGYVWKIVLSGDGKWIVSGQGMGVVVWNRNTRQEVFTVNKRANWVVAVDVSPDSTKFITGSMDTNVFIWDILTGDRLVGPLEQPDSPTVVKFSPSGDRIVAVERKSLRIYNAHTGEFLTTIWNSNLFWKNPIVWSGDSQRIFLVLSNSGTAEIRQIHVDTGTSISQWAALSADSRCGIGSLILSSNDRFIASFIGRSLSFWDASTCVQLGSVVDHSGDGKLSSVALSLVNVGINRLATGSVGGKMIIQDLDDVIPASHPDGKSVVQQPQPGIGVDPQQQIEALRPPRLRVGAFPHNFILRQPTECQHESDEMTKRIAQSDDLPQAQAAPPHISNGIYRIKSMASDLYLTCPQGAASTAVVQGLDQSSLSQTVCHYPFG